MLRAAVESAEALGTPVRVGSVFTSDLFYHPNFERLQLFDKMGILAIEMEAAGLYGAAAEFGAKALTIATVSDHILTGASTTPEERQTSFAGMHELACETAIRL